jgi:hypothetical protein
MKKIGPASSRKSKGLIKYGKLILGAYALEKLKPDKSQKEMELEKLIVPEESVETKVEPVEVELSESGKGSSMKIGKFVMGALVGATAIYALKKRSTKKSGYKISVE